MITRKVHLDATVGHPQIEAPTMADQHSVDLDIELSLYGTDGRLSAAGNGGGSMVAGARGLCRKHFGLSRDAYESHAALIVNGHFDL